MKQFGITAGIPGDMDSDAADLGLLIGTWVPGR